MRGKATLVRFADDFVMIFETYHDAKRVMDVLGKRVGRFGLLSQASDKRPNQKHRVMRRKRPVHPFCSGNRPLDLRIISIPGYNELSQASRSGSRFQRGGFDGRVDVSTFASACRFVSRLARA
jgi:hypothetical protein